MTSTTTALGTGPVTDTARVFSVCNGVPMTHRGRTVAYKVVSEAYARTSCADRTATPPGRRAPVAKPPLEKTKGEREKYSTVWHRKRMPLARKLHTGTEPGTPAVPSNAQRGIKCRVPFFVFFFFLLLSPLPRIGTIITIITVITPKTSSKSEREREREIAVRLSVSPSVRSCCCCGCFCSFRRVSTRGKERTPYR